MVELLRHRQTKEAETDMFSLKPPRHIPTLPWFIFDRANRCCLPSNVRFAPKAT
jgi:hypothetical protein